MSTLEIDPAAPLTNATLQAAVDRQAAAGGGVVRIPAGVYLMYDALHLRTGVRIVGTPSNEGTPGTVLRNVPSVSSKIPDFLGYGHYEFTVTEPDKFCVGMGIHLLDDNAMGFYTTVATIIGRQSNRLFINRPMNHDYHRDANARAISVHALVEGEGVQDASIEDVTLDGDMEHETQTLNGCRGGGVFLIRCGRVSLRRLEVTRYRGDGISFQQCHDILIQGCDVHHNAGGGLHPGSGSVRYVLRANRCRDNGAYGIFYCLRTTHSICVGNDIRSNGQAGISIGERDTDHYIAHNTIAHNASAGIEFRPPANQSGDRVILQANQIGPNARLRASLEVEIPQGLRDIHLLDNLFTPTRGVLNLPRGLDRVSVRNNLCLGQPLTPEQISQDAALAADALIAQPLPAVSPADLPLDGAAHLGIARLEPWVEPE